MTAAHNKSRTVIKNPALLAALDLGSNSFHLAIARILNNELHIIETLSEKVQLGAGFDKQQRLTAAAQRRALDCIQRFSQYLKGMPRGSVRVVGTNALRMAHNAPDFIKKAYSLLGHPIEIIAGREEARLIYLGVSHTLGSTAKRRLVVDIGGGSTEFIIGQKFEAQQLESLHMGCVSFTQRYFNKGIIQPKAFEAAMNHAAREVLSIQKNYKKQGWQDAIGSSGTIKSIQQIILNNHWDSAITLKALKQLAKILLQAKHVDQLKLDGLKEERRGILPAGLAILMAIFNILAIERMEYCEGALREGVLYDLLGRVRHEDVRQRTIQALIQRYDIDQLQAKRVAATAITALSQVAKDWHLADNSFKEILSWAAQLHEIGLSISHTQFHKHGDYLLRHADLAGFSKQEQALLATLVRAHRQKFPLELFKNSSGIMQEKAMALAILLRLAVLLHHPRLGKHIANFKLKATNKNLKITFPKHWLAKRPLTAMDLAQESIFLKSAGYILKFKL